MNSRSLTNFPPIELSVPYFVQETQVWCCAAVARMVIAYYRGEAATPPQSRLVELILDLPEGHCSRTPMPTECIQPSDNYLVNMLVRAGGARLVRELARLDAIGVYAALAQRNLIIAELRTADEVNHVIVIRGVWVRDREAFAIDVLVNDPSEQVGAPLWIPYGELTLAITRLLVVYKD